MNKFLPLIFFALCVSMAAHAAVSEQWTFEYDPRGTVPANALNIGTDGTSFEPGGSGILEADGYGALVSTPSAATLWGAGANLNADISDVTGGDVFLRYDLNYNLNGGGALGTTAGISLLDETGAEIAGLSLCAYPNGLGSVPFNHSTNIVPGGLLSVGTISVIAKVSFGAVNTISVWYDVTGSNTFVQASPAVANQPLSFNTIDQLRLKATGSSSGDADDYVAFENIRVADSWAEITSGIDGGKYLNEWTFEYDPAGRSLSQALNTGTDGAVFSANAPQATRTDGQGNLICENEAAGTGTFWTQGAILTADVLDQSSGVRFLRTDFDYDMTSAEIDSGTLFGLFFTDSTGAERAGIALKYDLNDNGVSVPTPANMSVTALATSLALSGRISVIAKVDIDNDELTVWYDLAGGNTFSSSNVISGFTLSSIEELELRATGDLIGDAITVDNIRTAATWDEITEIVIDVSAPPTLTAMIVSETFVATQLGETNTVSVEVKNTGGIVSGVYSTLELNPATGLSIIDSDNTPGLLLPGASVVNTFQIVATREGAYQLTPWYHSASATGDGSPMELLVGPRVRYDSYELVAEGVGGSPNALAGEIEPGEVFELEIISTNDSLFEVSNVTNTLIGNANMAVTLPGMAERTYASMAPGATDSTVYRIQCAAGTPDGWQTLTVVNTTAAYAWTNTFRIYVVNAARLTASPLTIIVAPGEIASASLTVVNEGNAPTAFTISDNGLIPADYAFEENPNAALQTFRRPELAQPETLIESLAPIYIGFPFVQNGTEYEYVRLFKDGWMRLSTDSSGDTSFLIPYETDADVDLSTMRIMRYGDHTVIACGNDQVSDNGTEFQVWFHDDGTIEYVYEYGARSPSGVGRCALDSASAHWYDLGNWYDFRETDDVRDYDSHSTNVFTYGEIASSLLVSQNPWVTYDGSGTVEKNADLTASTEITFTADASNQSATGTYEFMALINWGTLTVPVDVTVIVTNPTYSLAVFDDDGTLLTLGANSLEFFDFSGPAGSISPDAVMVISNSGTASLSYSIESYDMRNASYQAAAADYLWRNAATVIGDADFGTVPIDIGFPFLYFGKTYTQVKVRAEGFLQLDSDYLIVPFFGQWYWDDTDNNGLITYVDTVGDLEPIYSPANYLDNLSGIRKNPAATVKEMTGAGLGFGQGGRVSYLADGNQFIVTWENMTFLNSPDLHTFQVVINRDGTIRFNYKYLSDLWGDGVVRLMGGSTINRSLLNAETRTFVTNSVMNTVTNWYTDPRGNEYPVVEYVYTDEIVPVYHPVRYDAYQFTPGAQRIISYSPFSGTILPSQPAEIILTGDARSLNVGQDQKQRLIFNYNGGASAIARVSFNVTAAPAPSSAAYSLIQAAMWGTDNPEVSVTQDPESGAHTISWPAASDTDFDRTYKVQYTLDLAGGQWKTIYTLEGVYSNSAINDGYEYIDDVPERNNAPVIFYRATVE